MLVGHRHRRGCVHKWNKPWSFDPLVSGSTSHLSQIIIIITIVIVVYRFNNVREANKKSFCLGNFPEPVYQPPSTHLKKICHFSLKSWVLRTKKHFWGLESSDPPSYSGKSPLKNRFFSPLSSSIFWSFGLKDAKLSGWLAKQIIVERLTSLPAPVRLDWKLGSVLSIHPP